MHPQRPAHETNSVRLPQTILFGADYNPEQWTKAMGFSHATVWDQDMALMRAAHVNIATIGVFSWASLQPDEDICTFDWLDEVFERLHHAGVGVCLATATAAQPAWLSQTYPDVLSVDETGRRRGFGERQTYCPTNPDFRRLARRLVTRLAERYGNHPALKLWHISNEYLGPSGISPQVCYCEGCRIRFHSWLQQRYQTLGELNKRWVTPFWSHTFTAWEQIPLPGPHSDTSILQQLSGR